MISIVTLWIVNWAECQWHSNFFCSWGVWWEFMLMFSDPNKIRKGSWMCLFRCVFCLCSYLLPTVFYLFLQSLSEYIFNDSMSTLINFIKTCSLRILASYPIVPFWEIYILNFLLLIKNQELSYGFKIDVQTRPCSDLYCVDILEYKMHVFSIKTRCIILPNDYYLLGCRWARKSPQYIILTFGYCIKFDF